MLVAQFDLQFLSPILVLLRPFGVVLPLKASASREPWGTREYQLHDLALFDDTLDLGDQ